MTRLSCLSNPSIISRPLAIISCISIFLLVLGYLETVFAQAPNKRYASYRECGEIDENLQTLYKDCIRCQSQSMDFLPAGARAGKCVPKSPSERSVGGLPSTLTREARTIVVVPSSPELAPAPESPTSPRSKVVSVPRYSPDNPFLEAESSAPSKLGDRPPNENLLTTKGCAPYFSLMRQQMDKATALCLNNPRLMDGLTKLLKSLPSDLSKDFEIRISRRDLPELHSHFKDKRDPRWRHEGDVAIPNCELSLVSKTPNDSITECARSYVCGIKAANCGSVRSQSLSLPDCRPTAAVCLAENPIPRRSY